METGALGGRSWLGLVSTSFRPGQREAVEIYWRKEAFAGGADRWRKSLTYQFRPVFCAEHHCHFSPLLH